MTNEPNYNAGGDNRPKLKKVKRPIKKVIGSGNESIPQKSGIPNRPVSEFNAPVKSDNSESFNIDSYLDNDEQEFQEDGNRFITEEDLRGRTDTKSKFIVGNLFTLNFVILVSVAVFIFGIILTKIMSSGEKVVQDGLQGVMINPEVPRGRARCGVAERTQGCVLYIMNPQRQELNARDFYDLAAQLTGRQKFVIETGNIRYSNVKIKPGAIAQFNIPPLIN